MTHWEIVHTSEVEKWLASTDMQLRRAVEMKVSLLRMYGPLLQRPHVDHIKGSRHSNMEGTENYCTGSYKNSLLFRSRPTRSAVDCWHEVEPKELVSKNDSTGG